MDSKEIIGKVLDSVKISEVVGKYVDLTQRGNNHFGLCPFHNEKTPSFSVNDDKGIYHCFGCGETGNAISFIMKYKELPFRKALLEIAKDSGVPIPENFNLKNLAKEESYKEKMISINQKAAVIYHKTLLRDHNPALTYLKAERQVSPEMILKFFLGYAPDSWELVSSALKTSASIEALKESGLFGAKEDRIYDRFRNKVMFPIFDPRGGVIAFGSRVLDDSKPKYINSPETKIFHKKEVLYGLNFAIEEARKKEFLYVVEGYMDVIMMHQIGLTNTAAPLGTAFSDEHIRLVRHYVKKAVFLFDGDSAGKKAARRSVEIALRHNFPVEIITLPEELDPFDFIVKKGKESFIQYLDQNRIPWDDYLIAPALIEKDILLRRKKIIEILKLFEQSDPLITEAFLDKLSVSLKIPKQGLADYFYKNRNRYENRQAHKKETTVQKQKQPGKELTENELERQMVFLLIHNPELYVKHSQDITEAFFNDMDGAYVVFNAFKNSFKDGEFQEKLFYAELPEDLTKRFQKDIFIVAKNEDSPNKNKYKIDPEKQLSDIRLALRLIHVRQHKEEILQMIKENEQQKNNEDSSFLLQELQNTLKEEKDLENKRKGAI